MANGKMFKKISNDDIFLEIKDMKKVLYEHMEKNELEHQKINNDIQNYRNNTDRVLCDYKTAIGKELETLKWAIGATLTITVATVIGLIFKYIILK